MAPLTSPFCSRSALMSVALVVFWLQGAANAQLPLSIQLSNSSSVVLSWGGSNFWLQASDGLSDPNNWQNASTNVDQGSGASATIAIQAQQQFFRLIGSPFLPPPTRLFLDGRDDRFYLYWDAVTGADGYNLYYANQSGISQTNFMSLTGGTQLTGVDPSTLAISNLVPGLTYYFVVTATNSFGESADSPQVYGAFGPHGDIHGSVYAQLSVAGQTTDVLLPGVTVWAVNRSNQVASAQAITDSEGTFIIPAQPYGSYQVYYSMPGYAPGVSAQDVEIVGDPYYMDPDQLFPLAGSGLVYGRVTLANGQIPYQNDSFFGLEVNAQVTLSALDGTVLATATPNELGDYVMTCVQRTNLVLTAQAEAAVVMTNINTFVTGEADLIIPNNPPVISSLTALWNGQPTNRVSPGATVQLQVVADDPDGDPLQYAWFPVQNADGLLDTNSPTTSLILSNQPAVAVLYVLVSDGRGGYASQRLDLAVTDDWLFSGRVLDTNYNPILGASVNMAGLSTFTDTNGAFSLSVPAEADSFALDISAPGYVPLSRYFTDPEADEDYILTPIGFTVCTNWFGAPVTVTSPQGASISLQADSLTNADGTYTGPICVSIVTYDPCDFTTPFPAGNDATNDLGQPLFWTPLAAAWFQITDPTNGPLYIVPTAPATITWPRGMTCSPPTNEPTYLPAWALDPNSGLWRPTAQQASRQNNPDGSFSFVGPAIALGVLAVGVVNPECVVTVKPDRTLNLPFELRVSALRDPVLIEQNGKFRSFKVPQNQALTIQVISQKESPGAYFPNAPANGVRLFKDKTAIVQVQQTFTQNTADLPLSLAIQLKSMAQAASDTLVEDSHFLTFRSKPMTGGGPFDAGNAYYGATAGVPGYFDSGALDAIKLINRFKLINFLFTNQFLVAPGNFPANYSEDAGALYFNANDLGFARSMHMKISVGPDKKTNIAYFVINYRRLEDAITDYDLATGKMKQMSVSVNDRDIATVAMDYRWDPRWQKRYTKFYVFDGGLAGNLRPDADLDGGDQKPVPNLCVVCHGDNPVTIKKFRLKDVWPSGTVGSGNMNTNFLRKNLNYEATGLTIDNVIKNLTFISAGTGLGASLLVVDPPDGDTGARFLPFDLEALTYSTNFGIAEAQFRSLNRGIYLYTPSTPAMTNLLEGWYNGPLSTANNTTFIPGFIPASWSAEKALYTNVVKASCRACHVSREGGLGFLASTNITKRSDTTLRQICSYLTMPDAQRTFSIFWGSQAANLIKPGAVTNQIFTITNRFGCSDYCPCPSAP